MDQKNLFTTSETNPHSSTLQFATKGTGQPASLSYSKYNHIPARPMETSNCVVIKKLLVLPPKRYQDAKDPVFDAIRWRGWFRKLEERRAKIPLLKQAHKLWLQTPALSWAAAADQCGVDERELRDYRDFALGQQKSSFSDRRKQFQVILDMAYMAYDKDNGVYGIRAFLAGFAKEFGADPRHVIEMWETDPTFYPSGYEIPKFAQ